MATGAKDAMPSRTTPSEETSLILPIHVASHGDEAPPDIPTGVTVSKRTSERSSDRSNERRRPNGRLHRSQPTRGAERIETLAERGCEVRKPQSSPRPGRTSRMAHCARGRMLFRFFSIGTPARLGRRDVYVEHKYAARQTNWFS